MKPVFGGKFNKDADCKWDKGKTKKLLRGDCVISLGMFKSLETLWKINMDIYPWQSTNPKTNIIT